MPGYQEKFHFDSGLSVESFFDQIERDSRYIPDGRALRELSERCLRADESYSVGDILYRARRMPPATDRSEGPVNPIPAEEMFAPPHERAVGGRLNPPGIPYLYLSTEAETAVAEMRPWKAARLTVGEFRVIQPFRVIDFVDLSDEPKDETFLQRRLAREFARPQDPARLHDYLPTQFIAEFLKREAKEAFAGVRYPSSLAEKGSNVALFGRQIPPFRSLLKCESVRVWRVKSVKVDACPV